MDKRAGAFSREWPLVAITAVWGTTFMVSRIGLAEAGPIGFVALRFLVASLALGLLCGRRLLDLRRLELLAGIAVGVVIALGSVLQTAALRHLPSSEVAFLTAFYVPLVPLLQWLLLRRPPGWRGWIGALAGFAGLALIAGPMPGPLSGLVGPHHGDTLLGRMQAVGCALAFGVEIILIGRYATRVDARRFAVVQVVTVSTACFAALPVFGEHLPVPGWTRGLGLFACTLYLGLASALVQSVVSWAQRVVSPTRATLIYATEPVWAGLIGRAAGETIGLRMALGAALIGLGVLSSSLPAAWGTRLRLIATRRAPAVRRRPEPARREAAAACRT